MVIEQIRDLLTQAQQGARISTAIGEPMQAGDRVVVPVAEVAFGGGGGGGAGKAPGTQEESGSGGGAGMGMRVRPLGCWVFGPDGERWVPAVDINRAILVGGAVLLAALVTIRAFAPRRR